MFFKIPLELLTECFFGLIGIHQIPLWVCEILVQMSYGVCLNTLRLLISTNQLLGLLEHICQIHNLGETENCCFKFLGLGISLCLLFLRDDITVCKAVGMPSSSPLEKSSVRTPLCQAAISSSPRPFSPSSRFVYCSPGNQGRGSGIFLGYRKIAGYLHRNKRKAEPKELPSCSVPQLQIAYTQQFEILVRALPENK